MSQLCLLFVPFWGGELPLGGEAEPLGRMAWDSRFRNCNSTNSLLHNHSWCGRYDSKIKWLPFVIFHRMTCCGSKKLRWWFLWTSLNPRDQIVWRIFQTSRCWTRRLLLLWTRSSRIPSSRRRSASRSRKAQKEDRFMIFDYFRVVLMMQHWIMLIYSLSLFMMIIFRNSIQDGTKLNHQCHKLKIRQSAQLKTVLELCDIQIHHKTSMPNIKSEGHGEKTHKSETSITKLWRLWRQAQEDWNRSRGQESKGMNRRWRRKNICYQWKDKGQCSQGDRCSFRHESNDRAQKPEHNVATSSELSLVTKSKWVEEEISEAIITMEPFSDNRADVIWRVLARDRLVNFGIHPNVNSAKQKRGAKRKISVCSLIIRLMNNRTKSQRKATILTKKKKTTTRMRWLLWTSYHNWVASRKTRMRWFLKRSQKVWGSIWKVRFTLSTPRQATIREKKGPSIGKIQVKAQPQRSPYAMKFEDRSREETEDKSDVPKARLGIFSKTCTSSERTTKLHCVLACGKVGTPGCVNTRAREFVVDSGASMQMVSKRDLNSAKLETMRTSRSPTTVMPANGEVQNPRRSDGICQATGRIRHGYASWKNSCISFSLEALWGSWAHQPLDQPSKTTSPKRARELIAIYQTVCHSWSLIHLGVPLQRPHPLHHHLHHRIPYLTKADTLKIQHQKEVEVRVKSCGETRCTKPQKPKNMRNAKMYKEIYLMNCMIGYRNSQRIWLMNWIKQSLGWNPEQGRQDTSKSSHELPMASRENVEPGSGKLGVYTQFLNKNNEGFLQKSCWYSRAQSGTFCDLITADHKILSEGCESSNNHRYAMVCTRFGNSVVAIIPVWTKTSQETQKSPMKFLERHGNQKSFTLTIPWNLASLARNEPGIIVRQHRTNQKQMGLQKEQCAESKKGHLPYCCNQVWTKNGGWIPWNVTAICETFKISCLMGRHPVKGGSECPLTDQ